MMVEFFGLEKDGLERARARVKDGIEKEQAQRTRCRSVQALPCKVLHATRRYPGARAHIVGVGSVSLIARFSKQKVIKTRNNNPI